MFGGAAGSNRDLKWRRHFTGSILLIQLSVGFIILFKSRQNLFGSLFSSSANRLIVFSWYIRFALYIAFLNRRLSRIYSWRLSRLSLSELNRCSRHWIWLEPGPRFNIKISSYQYRKSLVRTITRHRFELESPNLHQTRSKYKLCCW